MFSPKVAKKKRNRKFFIIFFAICVNTCHFFMTKNKGDCVSHSYKLRFGLQVGRKYEQMFKTIF